MDRTIYKNFVKKYGELEIIVYGSDKNIDSEFSMLKEESPLYSLGYSVNQKDNYSDAVRHEILIKIPLSFENTILYQKSEHITYICFTFFKMAIFECFMK